MQGFKEGSHIQELTPESPSHKDSSKKLSTDFSWLLIINYNCPKTFLLLPLAVKLHYLTCIVIYFYTNFKTSIVLDLSFFPHGMLSSTIPFWHLLLNIY